MNNRGLMLGYYVGLLFRLVWHVLFATVLQTIFIYIFGSNYFTVYVVATFISLLISLSLISEKGYSIISHSVCWISLVASLWIADKYLMYHVLNFFYPDRLWSALSIISIIFGVLVSVGRYGHGSQRKIIETIGNLLLIIVLILAFSLYWWKGGVIYLLVRIPLMLLENTTGNTILHLTTRRDRDEGINQ